MTRYKATIDTIQQAVKSHDQYQIEIKLDYELLESKKTHYQISTYIFVPKSLGIGPANYHKHDFYRDVQNYIRLKTPIFILRDFTENPTSPLLIIENLVASKNWPHDPACKEQVVNNLKFLSAMFKSSARDHFNLIQQRIQEALPTGKVHLMIRNLVEEFLVESQKIIHRYRNLLTQFNLPHVQAEVFTAYKLTDESLSLLIEEHAIEMFQIVEAHLKKADRSTFGRQLSELVKAETKHRKARGYGSVLKPNDDNEEYTFRTSALKKYASSVLFLSSDVHREGVGLEQLFFALAAGLAMIFATVVAFFFQYQYGNFTFSFFIALVVGYMFKDRIKEVGRAVFSTYLQNHLYDRRTVIRTQDGKHKLGILKEKMTFVKEKNVPSGIMRGRNKDPIIELDNDGYGENIIFYSKEVELYTTAFKRIFANTPPISGINDIIRYDIRPYLNKMAEPVQQRYYLQDEQLLPVTCHKVYHLDLVSRYHSPAPEKAKLYRRVRLILDRQGIKRVDHIPV